MVLVTFALELLLAGCYRDSVEVGFQLFPFRIALEERKKARENDQH